ncbi:MAG: paraquat-inducible protein A [Gammaproteobacteria bacterium]|nr:paraquat-inducible protein A [Gammaproteobacteria bacterium]
MIKHQYFLYALWTLVFIGYVLGIILPIATVEKFIFFKNEFSLLSSIFELLAKGGLQNIFLGLIIFIFTIIFPIAKLITMFLQIKFYQTNWQNSMTRFIESVGHFSMLDVFVIALMVLLLKLRMLVDVEIHQGFYWFTASIVISIVLSFIIKKARAGTYGDEHKVEKI